MIVEGNEILADLDHPMDISIPLQDGSGNPNCYGTDAPKFTAIVQGDFIGSVAMGGPCNHQRISIAPHGNGTHTECYGHISPLPEATLNKCLKKFHFIAKLISVEPRTVDEHDQVIRWADVKKKVGDSFPEALIIRTLPNTIDKLGKQYSGNNPPYLEPGFGEQLATHGVSHLLVDLPSVDKEEDGGRLRNHHGFWNHPENPRTDCTITELIFAPEAIPDETYLLNLQICSIESDASPSKPVIYRLIAR